MKVLPRLITIILILSSCKSKKINDSAAVTNQVPQIEKADTAGNFFPVTSYIKGEILNIKNSGITPVRTISAGNHTDTSWIKINDLDAACADFLTPVIDTANLKNIFAEKKFLDLTLNAFTFTYDPVKPEDNAFPFKHWDVYVDPETGKVKRIYLVKEQKPDRELQLTWLSGKWCKIVTLRNISGKTIVEKEEKISRSY